VTDDEPEYAYLTTMGRRTRKPHRIEIWYWRTEEVVWFISGGLANADWVKNLIADPRVMIEIGAERLHGTAFVDDQDAHDARRGLAARYQGWREGEELSGWATNGMTIGVRLDGT
jgi:deazaflavin-dependent oxidoreductase (nitroreductase family)